MSEKPIIFPTPMVLAILDGRKTQARRPMKKQLGAGVPSGRYRYDGVILGVAAIELLNAKGEPTEHYYDCEKPPYVFDDILWVRESWKATGISSKSYSYKASDKASYTWRQADVMPREAARIFLRVTEVGAERLQDMSLYAVWDEGTPQSPDNPHPGDGVNHDDFKYYWDSQYAFRGHGWDTNPWVWVYTFARCAAPNQL